MGKYGTSARRALISKLASRLHVLSMRRLSGQASRGGLILALHISGYAT